MTDQRTHEAEVEAAMAGLALDAGIRIRAWRETDFADVQRLSAAEGWPTTTRRPAEALTAWQRSWPALVAVDVAASLATGTADENSGAAGAAVPEGTAVPGGAVPDGTVVGLLRALTDGEVTTYVAEVLVAPSHRGQRIGVALLEVCHRLCPHARLDLLSTGSATPFYEAHGFRPYPGYRRSYL